VEPPLAPHYRTVGPDNNERWTLVIVTLSVHPPRSCRCAVVEVFNGCGAVRAVRVATPRPLKERAVFVVDHDRRSIRTVILT
jgi:hypothetical protein